MSWLSHLSLCMYEQFIYFSILLYFIVNCTTTLCISMETVQLLYVFPWKLYNYSMYFYGNCTTILCISLKTVLLLYLYVNYLLLYLYISMETIYYSICISLCKLVTTLSVNLYVNYLLLYLYISMATVVKIDRNNKIKFTRSVNTYIYFNPHLPIPPSLNNPPSLLHLIPPPPFFTLAQT